MFLSLQNLPPPARRYRVKYWHILRMHVAGLVYEFSEAALQISILD